MEARSGWKTLAKPWTIKKGDWSASILPEGRKSDPAGNFDLLACDVVYAGGIDVLESFRTLDTGTLAALIEWNRANLLRMERQFLIRRSVVVIIAVLGIIGKLQGARLLDGAAASLNTIRDVLRLLILDLPWTWLIVLFIFIAVTEFFVWRPRKARLEEFGQMLAVAFAYVSKHPFSNPKSN